MSQSYKINSHQSNTMQFCDHKRSSRHCGFYSPQVSSLDNTSVTNSDMREVVREEEDEYVVCDSDATLPHLTRDTAGLVTPHVSSVPSPLARILGRRVSTCPVLVSHLLASHYSTRYVSSHHIKATLIPCLDIMDTLTIARTVPSLLTASTQASRAFSKPRTGFSGRVV